MSSETPRPSVRPPVEEGDFAKRDRRRVRAPKGITRKAALSLIRADFAGPSSPASGRRWGRVSGLAAAVVASLVLQACSASPSQDILGSFFPSWLLCALLGLVGTVAVRWALVVVGIDRFVPFALVTYTAMGLAFTCLFWLVHYGN